MHKYCKYLKDELVISAVGESAATRSLPNRIKFPLCAGSPKLMLTTLFSSYYSLPSLLEGKLCKHRNHGLVINSFILQVPNKYL